LVERPRIDGAGFGIVAQVSSAANAITIGRIVTALEHEGVEFIEEGVRLIKKPRR
jgi:hypothetical protein